MRIKLLILAGVFLLSGMLQAQFIAYDVPVQPGNENWPGNLGLDFNVNSPIIVTSLGVFDNNGNGFTGSVTVAIFNRTTQTQVGPSVTMIGTAGTLVNGNRMVGVTPFVLPAGQYSVVAVGFNATDLTGSPGCVANPNPACLGTNAFTPSTENTGGGLISFVTPGGRYDSNGTLDYPVNVDPNPVSNNYIAGTFQFQGYTAPTLTKTLATPFGEPNIGDTIPATFVLTNPNPVPLTGVTFTDVLPDGLQVQNPSGLAGVCSPGSTIALSSTTTSITYNGSLPAGGSCTITVNLVGVAPGAQTNGPITVTSNEAPPGTSAATSVYVSPLFWLWFFFST